MKKITLILLVLLVTTGAAFGQTVYDEKAMSPLSPEYMAQGGSFVAVPHGYNSFFTNPAGYAVKGGSLTLLSANVGVFADIPTFVDNPDAVMQFAEIDFSNIGAVLSLISPHLKNGFGPNITAGVGFAGRGLGLGLMVNTDLYMNESMNADADVTAQVVVGLAFPIKLGPTTLYIGGDIRPMLRTSVKNVTVSQLTSLIGALSEEDGTIPNIPIYHGFGLAIDGGILWEAGPLTLGASVRDIGSQFLYNVTPAGEFIDYLGTNSTLPVAGEGATVASEDVYAIPLSLRVGLGFHPDLGGFKYILDPKIHVEYRETFYNEPQTVEPSLYTKLHAGAEIKLLSLLKIRAGLNQGYLTAGLGLKLLILDVNVAYFSNELGPVTGSKRSTGLTVEAAVRF